MASDVAGQIGAKKAESWLLCLSLCLKGVGWLTFPKPPPASQPEEGGPQEPGCPGNGNRRQAAEKTVLSPIGSGGEIKQARVAAVAANESLVFPTGALTPAQLRGLFGALPLDITFVDADDRVRYFSEGPDRVFARSKAILGRKVQHCHPPKSVHIVEQIVDDFKSGRQSVAEFWITLHGKFVHIRYFAVRDETGTYQGTLEVTQDLTRLRALAGERRLLEYDEKEKAA